MIKIVCPAAARPIDANVLLKHSMFNGRPYAIDAVNAAPTLDYAPMRCGEWEEKRLDRHRNIGIPHDFTVLVFRCPICGKIAKEKYNFCPNCGAKMGEQ